MKIKVVGEYDGKIRTFKVHVVPFVARRGPLVGETLFLHWDSDKGCWSITEGTTGTSLGRGDTLTQVMEEEDVRDNP